MLQKPGERIKILQILGGFQFHHGWPSPSPTDSLMRRALGLTRFAIQQREVSREKGTERAQMGLDGS